MKTPRPFLHHLLVTLALMGGPSWGVGAMLAPPAAVSCEADGVVLRVDFAPGGMRDRAFLLAVGEGSLDWRAEDVVIRHRATGRLLEVATVRGEARQNLERSLLETVKVEELGHLRGLRLARLAVDTRRAIQHDGAGWQWVRGTFHVKSEPPAPTAGRVRDTALAEGQPLRRLADALLANPDCIDRYISPHILTGEARPAAWSPRPALSPGMPWIEFDIVEDGLVAIDGAWLTAAGIDPATVDPAALYVVSGGTVLPTHVIGPPAGGFAAGQRLLLYARQSTARESRAQRHYLGRRPDSVAPVRFEIPATPENAEDLAVLHRRARVEEDITFKTRIGAFLSIRRMSWVGAPIPAGGSVDVPVPLDGMAPVEEDLPARLRLYFDDERLVAVPVRVLVGDHLISEKMVRTAAPELSFAIPSRVVASGTNIIRVELAADSSNQRPANGVYIDAMTVDYPQSVGAGVPLGEVDFSLDAGIAGRAVRLRLPAATSRQVIAVDVGHEGAPALVVPEFGLSGGMLSFVPGLTSRLLIREPGELLAPPPGRPVAWRDITSPDQSADVLLIHHPLFREAAELLAEHHRSAGRAAVLTTTEDIYTAFSHGNASTEAIRKYIQWAVSSWTGRRPGVVVLIGDANGDGHDVARQGIPNFLPCPLVPGSDPRALDEYFGSDAWYGWLTPDDEVADVLVGRIPSSRPEEALATVRNVIAAAAAQPEPWGARVLALADASEFAGSLDGILAEGLPPGWPTETLRAGEFPWEDNYYLPAHLIAREEDSKVTPLLTARIEQEFNDGAGLVMFLGHGAPNLWSNQRIWFGGGTPNSDILRLRNAGRLPFVASFTCNNAVVDYPLRPWNVCIGEDFIRHEGRGALACFMPSGPGYLRKHEVIAEGLLRAWTELRGAELGIIAEAARLYHQTRSGRDEHARMFMYLGDPLARLPSSTVTTAPSPAAPQTQIHLANEVPVDASHPLRREWIIELRNPAPQAEEARWVARLVDAAGCEAARRDGMVTIGPREAAWVPVMLEAPAAGGYTVTIELVGGAGTLRGPGLPSRVYTRDLVIGRRDRAGLQLLAPSIRLERHARGAPERMIRVVLANPTGDFISGRLVTHVESSGRPAVRLERSVARLPAGAVVEMLQSADIGTALPVRLRFVFEPESGPGVELARHELSPSTMPDLMVLPDSVRVEPDDPTDGLTLFISAIVRNAGGIASLPATVGLYDDRETPPARLRDITTRTPPQIPVLKPGEEHAVRLRWDPFRNSGKYAIRLSIDAEDEIPDANRANNDVTIPLQVRGKWRLDPGPLKAARGADGQSLMLAAQVGNSGETDARNVVVTFYRSQQQNESTRIGEVVLERVRAGVLENALLEWRPTRAEIESGDLRPSFTVSLRGSLQRASSVAGD